MLNCPNVAQAMRKFFHFHDLMNDVVYPKMDMDKDRFYVNWDLFNPNSTLDRHMCEALLAIYWILLRHLTQNKIELLEVRFAYPRPDDISELQAFFRAPLYFERSRNELVADKHYLATPLFWANPELLATLEAFAHTQMQKLVRSDTWSEQTVNAINSAMAKGEKITVGLIAKQFGVSTRNLQLKLQKEDTTFQGIFDDVRKTVAFQYLKKRTVDIIEIAFLLGFSEQSAFNHAFKRWTGITPWEYVKANQT